MAEQARQRRAAVTLQRWWRRRRFQTAAEQQRRAAAEGMPAERSRSWLCAPLDELYNLITLYKESYVRHKRRQHQLVGDTGTLLTSVVLLSVAGILHPVREFVLSVEKLPVNPHHHRRSEQYAFEPLATSGKVHIAP